ncbi:MAG: transcription antitermination factor NusB [Balneolaceae bacterium]
MIERRLAREAALQALYAYEIGKNDIAGIKKNILKVRLGNNKPLYAFAEKLLIKTINNKDEINAVVEEQIMNWDMHRLAAIDKIILQMAVCEYIFFEEIPTKVTLNESIELAKKYSTSKSGTFVNGILDGALKKLKEDNRIFKKGRGLIEKSSKQ